MNKQEVIKQLNNETIFDYDYNKCIVYYDTAINIISQIDDRPKVKIPQFVADWIEKCKNRKGYTLSDALSEDVCPSYVNAWFYVNARTNEEIFARAWLDGYEVEQEKKYTVRISANKQPLSYNGFTGYLFGNMGICRRAFTKQEIEEAGFDWVFDCEGIEIEEVEE